MGGILKWFISKDTVAVASGLCPYKPSMFVTAVKGYEILQPQDNIEKTLFRHK